LGPCTGAADTVAPTVCVNVSNIQWIARVRVEDWHLRIHFLKFLIPLILRQMSPFTPCASWSSVCRDVRTTRTEEHYGMLVIHHRFRFTITVLPLLIPLVGRILGIVVVSEPLFFPGAFVAYPACVDVAVIKDRLGTCPVFLRIRFWRHSQHKDILCFHSARGC